jgi:hypothetical protein
MKRWQSKLHKHYLKVNEVNQVWHVCHDELLSVKNSHTPLDSSQYQMGYGV